MSLLERIRAHLSDRGSLARDSQGEQADLELSAATAVLLLEAAYGDQDYAWSEHRTILRGLESGFGIGRREAQRLLDRAEEIRPPAVKLADVTGVIAERYDLEQRKAVLALVWNVVEADRVVEDWEESFASHVAGALGLSAEQAREARES